MEIKNITEICKKHKLEIQTDTTPYGRSIIVYIDDKKIDNEGEFSDLLDWSYTVLNETILNQLEILDSYSCEIFIREENINFDFEFDNSWEYEGLYSEDRVTPNDLLPYLPDFIKGFEGFENLDLDEESLFCAFTYEEETNNVFRLDIHDVWSEGEIEMSFVTNENLMVNLRNDLVKRITLIFSGHDKLWICSEDGIDISLLSTYKKEFKFNDLFG